MTARSLRVLASALATTQPSRKCVTGLIGLEDFQSGQSRRPGVAFVKEGFVELVSCKPAQLVFAFPLLRACELCGKEDGRGSIITPVHAEVLNGLAEPAKEIDGAPELFADFALDGRFGRLALIRAAAREKVAE